MFRYERPQAGLLRQFHQIGLEFLGFADPRSDVEAIAVAWDLLAALGVQQLSLELNSLGSSEDRAHYRQALEALGIPFQLNPRLVRGGGRYDGLVEHLGGRPGRRRRP